MNKTLQLCNQINARKCTCIFPENKGERIYYGSHFEGLGSVMEQGCMWQSRTVCAVLGQEAENGLGRYGPYVMHPVTYCLPLGPPAILPQLISSYESVLLLTIAGRLESSWCPCLQQNCSSLCTFVTLIFTFTFKTYSLEEKKLNQIKYLQCCKFAF